LEKEMLCEEIRQDGVAERYLQGSLTETEREAYERHYFACEECLAEVESLEGLRAALSQAKSPGRAIPAWAWVLAACLVLTVGIRLTWTARNAPAPQLALRPAIEPAASPARPDLLALAEFKPPAYSPVVMRGAESEAALVFRKAMDLYQRGDFGRAANGLRKAAALDKEDPAARFYLGVSQLLAGQTEGGLRALRATIAMGETDFREPARFYLAKGLLRAGDAGEARRQLDSVAGSRSPLHDEARQLLDKLTP
jgi:tetratricopeptide (TPR) repeat protein